MKTKIYSVLSYLFYSFLFISSTHFKFFLPNLWADKHLKRVAYSQRRRGDLVFYCQTGTHTIWHVAIYLGHNRVIESWPPCVMVAPISNNQRNVIAGIKRPFI
ncbi:hypothetical protein GDZ32_04500 [Lactobacillus helveticus]|uniref:NlpC/P60 domain-containing protein n=1 Tax=Lactobacillus helveticus TaxID=1587 RepID=A0A6A7K111_LACHE|nr:hypothetical protein [Lactobacillus helveticus]